MGPHSFYWFSLTPQKTTPVIPGSGRDDAHREPSRLPSWTNVFTGRARLALEEALLSYSRTAVVRGKAVGNQSATFVELVEIPIDRVETYLTQVEAEYTEVDPERYTLPLAFASGEQAAQFGRLRTRVSWLA